MIRGGTTTYCDMYYFEDAIADETKRAGVRGVLGETVIDFPVADNKTWDQAMSYTERYINKWKNDSLIVPAIAPHAPYTVSTDHLRAVRALSDRLSCRHCHPRCRDARKNATTLKSSTATRRSTISTRSACSMTARSLPILFGSRTKRSTCSNASASARAHNPQSNMKLASGVAPVPQMLAKDVAVGLGTDGAASNNDLNMWEEMDTAAKLHKEFTGDPKVVTAEQAFEMATIRGARALHLDKLIGSLEVGKRADIVIVDWDDLNQMPSYSYYSGLVYATKANDVRDVIVNGRILMKDRRLLTLNENAIKIDANTYRKKIIESLRSQ